MKDLLCVFLMLLVGGCSVECRRPSNDTDQINFRKIEENSVLSLYDAFGEDREGMVKDFGFSCLINYKGKIILFDSGTNADIFKANVEAMKIDLTQVDFAVASHSHFDHINGFDYLLEVNPDVKIYFPFDMFWGANIPFDISGMDSAAADSLDPKMRYFGGDYQDYKFNQTGRFWNANIEFVKESTEIGPGITLIATSSPYMGYFNKYPGLEGCENCESEVTSLNGLKEISLSLASGAGEILFVGCSHSTVEKIITGAKDYTKNDIEMVYGGYHLLPYDREVLTSLASRLQNDLGVKKVAPAHCTGHLAFKILQDRFKSNYIFAGLGETVGF